MALTTLHHLPRTIFSTGHHDRGRRPHPTTNERPLVIIHLIEKYQFRVHVIQHEELLQMRYRCSQDTYPYTYISSSLPNDLPPMANGHGLFPGSNKRKTHDAEETSRKM